jgi:hypothetical protein
MSIEGTLTGLLKQILKGIRRSKSDIIEVLDTFVQEDVAQERLERVKLQLDGKAED